MMKPRTRPDGAQRLKNPNHVKSTSTRRERGGEKKAPGSHALIFRDYKAASQVQWKLHTLCENDLNAGAVIKLRHVVN